MTRVHAHYCTDCTAWIGNETSSDGQFRRYAHMGRALNILFSMSNSKTELVGMHLQVRNMEFYIKLLNSCGLQGKFVLSAQLAES